MKHLLICLILSGCATVQPVETSDGEASAAIGNVSFWRWAGRVVITMIEAFDIKVNIETKEK
jgi:uncharacterized protein YceK